MLFIPGILISIITFPGVIIHELAHQIFCRLFRIPVFEVCYFRFANPVGFVIHETTDDPKKNFYISVGPFIVNSVIGLLIVSASPISVLVFNDISNPLNYVLLWLGFSVLMHSFPSTGDAKHLYESVIKNKEVNLGIKILVFPIVCLIYLGAIGSVIWLDAGYAFIMCFLIPNLLVNII